MIEKTFAHEDMEIELTSYIDDKQNIWFYHMTRRRRSHEIAQRLRKSHCTIRAQRVKFVLRITPEFLWFSYTYSWRG